MILHNRKAGPPVKVQIQKIAYPYTSAKTASLQAILRNHAHGMLCMRIGTQQLYDIMGELARRREASGTPFRSDEESLADFVERYKPRGHMK